MAVYPHNVIQVKLPIAGDSSPASASAELLAPSDGNGSRNSSWERTARRALGFLSIGPSGRILKHPLYAVWEEPHPENIAKDGNVFV